MAHKKIEDDIDRKLKTSLEETVRTILLANLVTMSGGVQYAQSVMGNKIAMQVGGASAASLARKAHRASLTQPNFA